jgi:hypothetical protein
MPLDGIITSMGQVDIEKLNEEMNRLRTTINPRHFSYPARAFEVISWIKVVGEESIYINLFDRREEDCGLVRINLRTGGVTGLTGLSYNTQHELRKAMEIPE